MFSLNPSLDVAFLSRQFAQSNRIQIHNFLEAETAEKISKCLHSEQIPWAFAYHGAPNGYIKAEQLSNLSLQQRQEMMVRIQKEAQTDYQYMYFCYPILDAYIQKWGQVPLLDKVLEFINSPPMLDFIRTLLNRPDILKGDAQATRFEANTFLKSHDDALTSEYRVAAYVLNFTPEWDPDWGGHLNFLDNDGNIETGFIPRFNALNIFSVPQRHNVSPIAPYTPKGRYSITGWFRYK